MNFLFSYWTQQGRPIWEVMVGGEQQPGSSLGRRERGGYDQTTPPISPKEERVGEFLSTGGLGGGSKVVVEG